MLLGTLGASMLGNMLTGKGVMSVERGYIIRIIWIKWWLFKR